MERRQQWMLLGGVSVGAGLMYLLDPERGGRRRSAAGGKASRALHLGGDALGKASRDLANRGRGVVARAGSRLRPDHAEDRVIEDRVRSKLGRVVSHPHAVEVLAIDGEVTLAGDVLASEAGPLLAAARSVRGVRKVDDQLRVHDGAAEVSSLQGGVDRTGRPRGSWPPAKRLLAATAGGAIAVSGFRRGDALGRAFGLAGLGLVARGLLPSGSATVEIHKSVKVNAPIEDVFAFWADFESFPRFMANVLEVRRTGENCWRWMVRGPAGTHLEWDADLTTFDPDRAIAWDSLPGSVVENSGRVEFTAMGPDATQVDIKLRYSPPAGALGHGVASLLGRDPKTEMDEDMIRFKSLIEDGKATANGETVTRADVAAGPVEPIRR